MSRYILRVELCAMDHDGILQSTKQTQVCMLGNHMQSKFQAWLILGTIAVSVRTL